MCKRKCNFYNKSKEELRFSTNSKIAIGYGPTMLLQLVTVLRCCCNWLWSYDAVAIGYGPTMLLQLVMVLRWRGTLNMVSSLSPAKHQVGFEVTTFLFCVPSLNTMNSFPRNYWSCNSFMCNLIHFKLTLIFNSMFPGIIKIQVNPSRPDPG